MCSQRTKYILLEVLQKNITIKRRENINVLNLLSDNMPNPRRQIFWAVGSS